MCLIYFFGGLNKHEFFGSYLKKNPQYKISSKIYLVDGQADGQMTKLLVISQNFVNTPKTEYLLHIKHTVSPFEVLQFHVV